MAGMENTSIASVVGGKAGAGAGGTRGESFRREEVAVVNATARLTERRAAKVPQQPVRPLKTF